MRPSVLLVLAAVSFLAAGCTSPQPRWGAGRWVDLTHAFSKDTIYWPTSERFRLETVSSGFTEKGYFYTANQYCAAEHGGTHVDAPIHFAAGGGTVDRIPLEKLIGPAAVIDVSDKAAADRDYRFTVKDFLVWEKRHGPIPEDTVVLLRTGYGRYWPDSAHYLGTAERGTRAVAKLHFPGLDPDAARWLAEQRRIKAVGLDTASIDYGQSTLFQSHRILSGLGIPIFENVAHLETLPATGAWVLALPMKIRGGSGAPLRLVGWIP